MIESGLIAERYEIRHLLGSGGMGQVYLAFDQLLRRPVALKTFSLGASPTAAESFLREARMAARLSHPNIVSVHDVGTADGLAFIAMEYVEGSSLAVIADEAQAWPSVLAMAREILKGLSYAHGRGVVHRDIKPSNLIRTEDGRVVLLDLGISFAVEATTQTAPSGLMGTPAYMAPEQIHGEAIDGRTDLFSLGVVLYQLLVAKSPFQAPGLSETLAQVLHRIPPAPSTLQPLPQEVDRFVLRLLAKSPSKRYQSAEEALAVIDRLDESQLTVPVHPRPDRAGHRVSLALSAGLVLVILSSFLAVLLSAPSRPNPETLPAPLPLEVGTAGAATVGDPPHSEARLPLGLDPTPPSERALAALGGAEPEVVLAPETPVVALSPKLLIESLPSLPSARESAATLTENSPVAEAVSQVTPQPALQPTPIPMGSLRIVLDRPARVFVDGKAYGQTQDREVILRAGLHRVVAVAEDGSRVEEMVALEPEEPQTVRLRLGPVGPGAVRVTPPGRMAISVFVDGTYKADCPCAPLELSAGAHTLKFVNQDAGFERTVEVQVKSGQTASVDLNAQ